MQVSHGIKPIRLNKEEHYSERSNLCPLLQQAEKKWIQNFGVWHDWFLSAAELMLAEAVGLVNTLDNWTVVDTMILSTKTPEKKRIFGKGNFQALTGIICWYNSLGFFERLEHLSCFCCPLYQRKFAKWQESQLCLSTSSACLLCLRRVSVSFSLWLPTESVFTPTDIFVYIYVQRELKEAWGVNVFDRYSVVLHIFRCNAQTKEAKLQISLAEIPLLR